MANSIDHSPHDEYEHIQQAPTGKLIRDFFEESKTLFAEGARLLRAEIDTARREIGREAKKAGPAAGMAGAGSVLGHVAVVMFAFAIAAALALALPNWLSFLITGAILAIAAAIFFASARNKVRSIELRDGTTVHNLQEDQRWAKGLTQSVRSNPRRDA